ncbi:UvrD-helicase domain-containing protein [bacterium]|nr:UvrD-helicase domain-containing protein [bacterium]
MQSPASSLKTKAIRAGAGAGKTYNLTHEVIQQALAFYAEKKRWPHFVVTTFTKKATQELSERLMTLALNDFPQAMDFVSSSQYLRVSTIHGVLDDFLKEHGHVIGLKSDFSYLKEAEALFISKKTLMSIIEEERARSNSLLHFFSFSQLHQFLRISGQKDLHGFLPHSMEEGLRLLDEKLKASKQSVLQILNAIPNYKLPEKWQVLEKILGRISLFLDIEHWKDSKEAIELIESLDLRSGLKLKSHPDSTLIYSDLKSTVEQLRDLTSSAHQIETIQNLHQCNQDFKFLQDEYLKDLLQAKILSSRIEMSDLEMLSLQVLRQDSRAAAQWSHKKDYWFIDEFQDTSPQQLQLLKALIQKKPYYLVGDPQQSIYLFRGARSEVFSEAFLEVEKNDGELHFLTKNYRSTPQLLSFINSAAFRLGENFSEMQPAREASNAQEDVVVFTAQKTEEDSNSELKFIEASIVDLQDQGVTLDRIAILVRRNKDLELIGQYLSRQNIPVHLHSSGLFWKRREVRAALSLLKFLLHPNDNENLVQLLRVPLITVSDQQLVDLMNLEGVSLWSKMKSDCEKGVFGRSGQILFSALSEKQTLGLVVAFEKALFKLGFFDFHLKLDPTGRGEGNLWKFVGLLKNYERERGASLVQFINDCDKAIENEASVDSPGSVEKNKVNVMTVHASKGLQFDYLFLPFLAQKPYREHHSVFSIDEKERRWSVRAPATEFETQSSSSLFEKKVLTDFHQRQDEEDLRVLYVALTRAIHKVYLSWTSPVHEKSWAHLMSYLLDSDASPSFTFRLKTLDETFLKDSKQTPEKTSTQVVRSPYQSLQSEQFQMQSQAVTKLVAKNQKNYRAAYVKKQQGILFHRLVEVIKYPIAKDLKNLLQTWFGDEQDEALQALNYILALKEPPMVDLIKNGKVEWAFRYLQNDKSIDGQVDLWSIHENALWVVDYKSGEKILLDKSFAQLAIYAEALQEHLQWQGPIKTAVIYPFLQTSFVRNFKDFSSKHPPV